MQTRGLKDRTMKGQMEGQTLFYRTLPTTASFQTNLQNTSRIKGLVALAKLGPTRSKKNSFEEKNNVFDVPMVLISEENCYSRYRES